MAKSSGSRGGGKGGSRGGNKGGSRDSGKGGSRGPGGWPAKKEKKESGKGRNNAPA